MSEWNFYSEHLYQRSSKNIEELEKNVEEYPFSSLASFLLLFHYKKTSHPDFEKFAKKVALHFRNAQWLQFILHQKPVEKEIESVPETKVEEKIEAPVEPVNEEPIKVDSTPNFVEQTNQEAISEQKPEDEKIVEEHKEEMQNIEVVAEVPHEEHEINPESVSEILSEQNTQPENENSEAVQEIQSSSYSREIPVTESENSSKTEELIAFDPLHTVDYFASQGIKLNEEELVINDKLGTQMKSFTAWLKSMKKLHATKLTEQSIASESLIQVSAEESNINTEILTEAMAEVLIKQDKKDKAIDMFNKLSLINPAKSAYFAAKIESIKLR